MTTYILLVYNVQNKQSVKIILIVKDYTFFMSAK